ncbi:MAG: NADH-quinone oxidoreductase subunit H [Candidatus Gastranaerophilaceae bacterium]
MDYLITPYVVLMMKYNLSYSLAFLIWYTIELALIVLLITITTSLSILLKRILVKIYSGEKCKNILTEYIKIYTDFFRSFKQEEITPFKADKTLFWIMPTFILALTVFIWCFLPYTANFQAIKSDMGIILFIAFVIISYFGIILIGYSSKNNFAILGAFRSCVQIISSIIPMLLSVMSIILLAGSTNLKTIIEQQYDWGCFSWYCIPAFIGFIVFFTAMLTITNSSPFESSDAENELLSGYKIEYSGIKYQMLILSQNVLTVAFAIYCTELFLGGYLPPIHFFLADLFSQSKVLYGFILTIEQLFWLLAKTFVLLFFMNIIKITFPRLRVDKIAIIGWKYLIPLSFINLLLVCLIKQGGLYV